ncbi:zinc finger protein 845-like [Spodoptera frugiperda]|uniref:Zinc finger protein 845-like n=1 Tax=Spodoptera frugiperda TaxID=7108 RepID=A0A9R0E4W4_SPOFR|nr:zinc finger protein 845-like [Spodoptera frugiperda]
MDFSKICRTCMQGDPSRLLNPIFMSEDTHDRFSAVIYSCIGVQIKYNDGLPQNMCSICMNLFNTTLKFRKQCKQVETELLKIIPASQSNDDNTNDDQYPTTTTEDHRDCYPSVYIGLKDVKSECDSLNDDDDDDDQPLKYFQNNQKNIKENSDADIYCINDNGSDLSNNVSSTTVKRKDIKTKRYPDNDGDPESTTVTEPPYVLTETYKKTRRVVCKICQKELSIRSIDTHMVRRHPGADERKLRCELCDRYVMKDKLNRHRLLTHGAVGDLCGYCKKEFPSKEVLITHVVTCPARYKKRKMSENARKIAECDICKMKMQRASLQKHKAVKHAGLRPVCEHCGKSFGNKFRLNEHYRAKHGYEKFKCSYCDFQSAGICAMRVSTLHMTLDRSRMHMDELMLPYFRRYAPLFLFTPFNVLIFLPQCSLCPATFKANNNLHMHKLTCHSKAYYSCLVCARSYKCKYYAVKHVRLTHSLYEPPNVIRLVPQ